MEDKEESITSLGLLAGMTIAAGYAMYFLAMESAGLIAKVQLRALNFVILLIGLLITYRAYRIRLGGRMDYLRGFGMGIFTTVVSTLCFALFLYIYLCFFCLVTIDFKAMPDICFTFVSCSRHINTSSLRP